MLKDTKKKIFFFTQSGKEKIPILQGTESAAIIQEGGWVLMWKVEGADHRYWELAHCRKDLTLEGRAWLCSESGCVRLPRLGEITCKVSALILSLLNRLWIYSCLVFFFFFSTSIAY